MNTPSRLTDNAFRRYLAIARRRWLLLVVCIVVAPIAAVAVAIQQPERYEAISTVLVSRQSIASQLSGSADVGLQQQSFEQILVTQARLARTPTVIRDTISRVAADEPGLTVQGLQGTSSVTADSDSDLMRFAVRRASPMSAKRLSIAYANAYVRYRQRLDSTALERALADVDSAIARASATKSGMTGNLVSQLESSRQQLQTRLALQSANAQVVAGPNDVTKVEPRPRRAAIFGLLIGVIAGALGISLVEIFDTRIRTSDETLEILDVPVLMRIGPPPSGPGHQLAMLEGPQSPLAESFRLLRGNLAFGIAAHDVKALMVTSAGEGEGKSTTIANLAVAAALAGQSVVVVDLDLRRPRLAQLFGANPGPGVTDVILGHADLGDALQDIALPTSQASSLGVDTSGALSLLASGALPPAPGEFTASGMLKGLIDELRDRFDIVFIDTTPMNVVGDAMNVSHIVDGVFLCARLKVVKRPMLRDLKTAIDRLRVPVLGHVVTGATGDEASYYGYGGYASAQGPSKA